MPINIELKSGNISKLGKDIGKEALERETKALARLVQLRAKEQLPTQLNLKKSWLQKGFRYQIEEATDYRAVASVYHKDSILEKQGGKDIDGHLAIPTEWAKKNIPARKLKPKNILNKTNAYRNERGDIMLRVGKITRKVFFFSTKNHFRDKIEIEKTARDTAKMN